MYLQYLGVCVKQTVCYYSDSVEMMILGLHLLKGQL